MSGSRNLTEAARWLKQARHDRDAARLNRDHGFHEHACFIAQQSAEKVLGHSTLTLSADCAQLEGSFGALADPCRRLDQLYIPTRYPNGLPDNVPHDFYDRSLSDQALADLDAVVACVERFVRP